MTGPVYWEKTVLYYSQFEMVQELICNTAKLCKTVTDRLKSVNLDPVVHIYLG